MGVVMVGPKLVRRIARETGQDVVRAWGNGTNSFWFVTDHHEHGWWDRAPKGQTRGTWGWTPENAVIHMTSCHTPPYDEVFTGDPVPVAERDQPPA